MILNSPPKSSPIFTKNIICSSSNKNPPIRNTIPPNNGFSSKTNNIHQHISCALKHCSCGRRRFIESAFTAALLPVSSSDASYSNSDYTDILNRVHPPRPDWYEELYASVLHTGMESYEAEMAGKKSQLFSNLVGKAKNVVEIGIGTGPNLKYYASDTDDVKVFGVDPNKKMEKYARAAAMDAGLRPENFKFIQSVGEAIPLSDASIDAVIGTLVLCSVKDVKLTLEEVKRVLKPGGVYLFIEHVAAKDGTSLKLFQSLFDPLQQTLSDGCHLTRETRKDISEAGFSSLELSMTFVSSASLISPHVYGVAFK